MCVEYLAVRRLRTERSRGLSVFFTTMTAVAALLIAERTAFAGPVGGSVVDGAAGISQSGNVTNVNQSSNRAIINWQGFSIGAGEVVNFNQPGRSSVTLNRVIGNETSVISGALNANGQVFIVNSAGVLFGKGAQVNVGGLVASTLDISNANFMAGNYTFSGSSTASVVNQGTIRAHGGGYVALLGNNVANDGVISARLGTVAMAAGSQITLNFGGNSLLDVTIDRGTLNALVANRRAIIANGGQVILTAKAADAVLSAQVNNSGIIQAHTIGALTGGASGKTRAAKTGSIKLLADGGTVDVTGKLDASAPKGGNGGFIETSGSKVKIADSAVITTKSATGNNGTWLVDPDGFTIAASGGDITGTALSAELANNNVVIKNSTDGQGSGGNINVNDAVSWSTDSILTLNATNNININAAITATGLNAGLVLNYGGYTTSHPVTAAGTDYNINMASGGSVTLSGANATLNIVGINYTLIHTLDQLAALSTSALLTTATGHYALGQNLDPTSDPTSNYNLVGPVITALTGTLAGLGHTISGLNVTEDAVNLGGYSALIGFLGAPAFGSTTAPAATVRDIGVVNSSFTVADEEVGALVAENHGIVRNSYASNITISGAAWAGGLVGENFGSIANSYASNVNVTGTARGNIGGLAGANFAGASITGSYATGSVTIPSTTLFSQNVGGLVGWNLGTIDNSHAGLSGVVMVNAIGGQGLVGGLVGSNSGTVTNSYADGGVVATGGTIGGLVGQNTGTVSNSYADGGVVGTDTGGVGGLVGVNFGGTIVNSHATGNVTVTENTAGNVYGSIGGLAGTNTGSISNSYAMVNVLVLGSQPVSNIGGLVGDNGGSITNSTASGGFVTAAKGSNVGGFVGINIGTGASITNSSASASVTGFDNVGGFVGDNAGANIAGSQASGNVTGTHPNGNVGGFVGENLNTTVFSTGAVMKGVISDSTATGTVTGAAGALVGGFVGYNNFGTLTGDTARGDVFGSNGNVGGFAGSNFGGTITGSLATGEVNGQPGTFAGSNTGTITNSTYDDVKADARAAAAAEAAARAAAEKAAAEAAAARAAAQTAQAASRAGDTIASETSEQAPPDPSLAIAGTQATVPPNGARLDASLKTIKDGTEADDRRERRRVTTTAATQKPRTHRGSGGSDLGATIRSIDVDGQRFDLKDGGKKDAPNPKP